MREKAAGRKLKSRINRPRRQGAHNADKKDALKNLLKKIFKNLLTNYSKYDIIKTLKAREKELTKAPEFRRIPKIYYKGGCHT